MKKEASLRSSCVDLKQYGAVYENPADNEDSISQGVRWRASRGRRAIRCYAENKVREANANATAKARREDEGLTVEEGVHGMKKTRGDDGADEGKKKTAANDTSEDDDDDDDDDDAMPYKKAGGGGYEVNEYRLGEYAYFSPAVHRPPRQTNCTKTPLLLYVRCTIATDYYEA